MKITYLNKDRGLRGLTFQDSNSTLQKSQLQYRVSNPVRLLYWKTTAYEPEWISHEAYTMEIKMVKN